MIDIRMLTVVLTEKDARKYLIQKYKEEFGKTNTARRTEGLRAYGEAMEEWVRVKLREYNIEIDNEEFYHP